ncbi:MAG: hypothetical protein U1E76_10660 [Planctomycetota bacterium]
MKQLILWAIGMILALVLFVGLVATFLIFQGRASDLSLDRLLGHAPAEGTDLPKAEPRSASPPANQPSPHDLASPESLGADEIQSLVADLKREKEKVQRQRAALEAEQQELERQKVDLAMREQQVERILSETTFKGDEANAGADQKRPGTVSADEESTLKSLASEYSAMEAKKAAQILKAMKDQQMAVQVLARMKSKARAKLLESIDSETAARYAEQLRDVKPSQPDQTTGQTETATRK